MKMMRTGQPMYSEVMHDQIDISTPKRWDDLTRAQVLFVCRLFRKQRLENEFVTMAALRICGLKIRGMHIIEGSKVFRFRYHRTIIYLNVAIVNSIKEKLRFLTGQSRLTINLFQYFRVGMTKYYGPESKLFNVSFDEFRSAENSYLAYNNTRDIQYLNRLVAILYRPKSGNYNPKSIDYNGDIREPFNDYLVKYRVKKIKRIPLEKKLAVHLFFTGCVAFMRDEFDLVFEEGEGDGTSRSRLYSALMLETYLKNGKVSDEKITSVNIYKIFAYMQAEREKAEKIT